MKNIIERKYYLKKIEPFISKDIIKVIVGQRRVGKSYLLLQIADKIKNTDSKSNIVFIDKEKFKFDGIRNYKDLVNFVELQLRKSKRNYIFIDEVQEIDEFERALRHFISKKNVDVYCSGSNSKIFSGEIATFLSGRYIEIKVFSLSFREYLDFNNFHLFSVEPSF